MLEESCLLLLYGQSPRLGAQPRLGRVDDVYRLWRRACAGRRRWPCSQRLLTCEADRVGPMVGRFPVKLTYVRGNLRRDHVSRPSLC